MGERAGWLQRLLLDPKQGFSSGLLAAMQDLGLADEQALKGSAPLSADLRQSQAMALVRQLMMADCHGSSSFWGMADGAQLDAETRCTSLRVGHRLSRLQGRGLMAEPLEAWDAVSAACQRGEPIRAEYTDGGKSRLDCPRDFEPRTLRTLVKLRPEALQRWGFPAP